MFHTPIPPRTRKRARAEDRVTCPGREEVKFRDVRLYLVEMKMGQSRRSFLSQLARSKGFMVEDALRWEEAFLLVETTRKKHKHALIRGKFAQFCKLLTERLSFWAEVLIQVSAGRPGAPRQGLRSGPRSNHLSTPPKRHQEFVKAEN